MWNNNNKFERLANKQEWKFTQEHKIINNIDEKFATQDVSIPKLYLLGNDSIYI